MANEDIKNYAKDMNVSLWKIAKQLKMTDSTFSRKLREDLPDKEKANIKRIVKDLSKAKA